MRSEVKDKLQIGLGVGTSSIIMIFVTLCLVTLSTLTLTTAQVGRKLVQKARDNTQAIYKADNEVEEILALLDETTYTKEDYKIKKVLDVDATKELEVIINLKEKTLEKWQLRYKESWDKHGD